MQPMIPNNFQHNGQQSEFQSSTHALRNDHGRGSMRLQLGHPRMMLQQHDHFAYNLGQPPSMHPYQIGPHAQTRSSFSSAPHDSHHNDDWSVRGFNNLSEVKPIPHHQPQQSIPRPSFATPYVTSSPFSQTTHTSPRDVDSATPRTTHMQPYAAEQRQPQFGYTPQDWSTEITQQLRAILASTNSTVIPANPTTDKNSHGGTKAPESAQINNVPQETTSHAQQAQIQLQPREQLQKQQLRSYLANNADKQQCEHFHIGGSVVGDVHGHLPESSSQLEEKKIEELKLMIERSSQDFEKPSRAWAPQSPFNLGKPSVCSSKASTRPLQRLVDHEVEDLDTSLAPQSPRLVPQSHAAISQDVQKLKEHLMQISKPPKLSASENTRKQRSLEETAPEDVHPDWRRLDSHKALRDHDNKPKPLTLLADKITSKKTKSKSNAPKNSSKSNSNTATGSSSQKKIAKKRRSLAITDSISRSKTPAIKRKGLLRDALSRKKWKKRLAGLKKVFAEANGKFDEIGGKFLTSPKRTSSLRHVVSATDTPSSDTDAEEVIPSTLVNCKKTLSARNVADVSHTLQATASDRLRADKSMSPEPVTPDSSSRGQKRKASATTEHPEDGSVAPQSENSKESEMVPRKCRRLGPLSKRTKNSKQPEKTIKHQDSNILKRPDVNEDAADDTILDTIYVASSPTQQSTSRATSTATPTYALTSYTPKSSLPPSTPSLRNSEIAISAFNYLKECARHACKSHKRQDNLKPEWWPAYYFLIEYLEEELEENGEFPDDVNTWKMLWMTGQLDRQFGNLIPEDKLDRYRPWLFDCGTTRIIACLQGIP